MSGAASATADAAPLRPTRLLRRNRPFRTLFSARLVSYAGDSLSLVALIFHVAETTGKGLAVALLLLVGDFAPSLLGPFTGALADRLNLRRLMVVCELVQAVVLLVIVLTMPSLPMLLALVAVRATASQLFQPASRAAVPALVGDSDLETANSTLGFGSNAAEAVGPLLAAALFPLVGLRGVLLVDAVSFLVSAVLLATLPSLPPASGDGRQPSLLRQARAGIAYLLSVPTVRVIFLGFTAVVAFNGVDDVALVLLAQKTFHVGESAVGLLLGAVGVGLVAGYAMLSRWGTRASMPLLLIAGFAVSSVGNLLTGLAWAVAAAIALQAVRGFGLAAMDVASSTLLQRTVPPGMLGRVFGNLYGAIGVAAATSYLAGGVLLDATSAPVTLMVAGVGGLVATGVVALRLPRAMRRADEDGATPTPSAPTTEQIG
ncbi:MFS transporter [Micromonospora saelicesensis]|uniref:Predicted arabinose efflux permease, MFS family n=1 Tax=Micromonospora saelicesensis TaxID=285676 RepID=A0A1C4VWV1_9ACTN|nr:MFS transporter [Micromonospora saelicesensis]SCE88199.1 Predicted arabinose efflux permease, MFS family [Micromonospora saelicesensis]